MNVKRSTNTVWSLTNFKPQLCGVSPESIIEYQETKEKDQVEIGKITYIKAKKDGEIGWNIIGVSSSKEGANFVKDIPGELKDGAKLTRTEGEDKGTYIYDTKIGRFVKKGVKTERRDCVNIPRAVWDEVCGDAAKDYVIDPTSGIVSAFQSVCLPSISAYLTQYKAMLTMVKSCFEQLLYTGEGDSGVCKQFLSVYLCDLIYEAIRCITDKSGKGFGDQRH